MYAFFFCFVFDCRFTCWIALHHAKPIPFNWFGLLNKISRMFEQQRVIVYVNVIERETEKQENERNKNVLSV